MFQRLKKNIKPLTPATVIAAGEPFLRSFGVTRQKAAYFINVAQAIQSGDLDLEALGQVSDEIAIEKLTSVKGIGQWTAKIYLLMALRRPDVWPVGDVALATAFKNLKGRLERPTQPELSEIALAWRPTSRNGCQDVVALLPERNARKRLEVNDELYGDQFRKQV